MLPLKVMKRVLLFISVFSLLTLRASSQEKCSVLMKSIAERYQGDCKKGLADGAGEAWGTDHYRGSFKKGLPHGKGTYEYADGSLYEGMWSKGQRHGAGKLTFRYNGSDSIQDGLWTNDEFKGNKTVDQDYRIITMRSIERYRVYRYSDGNEIRVILKPMSSGSLEVSNLQITGSSGYESEFLNSQMEFRTCDYPFKLRVTFNKWSKLKTVRVDASIELEILIPGVWIVEIGA
jgi:hypothetical protein